MSPGQHLLHYRLIEKIGEGGMGVVWKALDTTLDREVAIKILPEAFATDAERMARFEREAKLLGTLNHPNIAMIFGLHETGGLRCIAMEFVPGENLANRLERGAMSLDEATRVAGQIADALEAAHARGVVHRDLKPANVRLTADGSVKVLDFGLAKSVGADTGGELDPTHSPTVTSDRTRDGVILGTAAYMSPEQARGRSVDRRSDVWAFGCVLFECLAGREAFPGETISDTLAAVLKSEPDWGELPPSTPEPVRRLLRRCLAKDPRRRLGSIGDARLDLEDALDEPPPFAASPRTGARWFPGLALVAAACLVIVAFVIFSATRGVPRSEDSIAFRSLTHQRGVVRSARISPDGQTVVYSAAWEGRPLRLFLQRLDSAHAPPVELQPGHARLLSISSRGELAILLAPDPGMVMLPPFRSGTLARVPLLGGTPRAVAEDIHNADWDPSGDRFALVRGTESGAQLEYPAGVVLHHSTGDIDCVRVSPSGDLVAFFDYPFFNNNRGTVAVVGLDGKTRTLSPEMEGLTGLDWSPDGDEIWFSGSDERGDALFAVDLSGRLRVLRRSAGSVKLHDTTPEGLVLMAHYVHRIGIAALAPGESVERDLSWTLTSFVTDISADGRRILFMNQDEMAYDVWLRETDGLPPTRLGPGVSFSLSPDGRWALAGLFSRTSTLTLLPTGPGSPRKLEGKTGALWADWTPDGHSVVWAAADAEGRAKLYVQGVDGGEVRTICEEGVQTGAARPFHVSPDGRWVAALGPDNGIKLYSIEGGEPRGVPGAAPGDEPSGWAKDGSSLFVSRFDVLPAQVFRLDLRTGARQLWRDLMPSDPAGIMRLYSVVITPDGGAYAYSHVSQISSLYAVTGLE